MLKIFLGDNLVSVEQGYNQTYGIPFKELAKVITDGAGAQWQYLLNRPLEISDDYNRWSYPFELFCGEVVASEEVYTTTYNGNAWYSSNFTLSNAYSKVFNPYPVCGTFVSGEVI